MGCYGANLSKHLLIKNLTRDALGLTSDRVYRWRLLLEEYGPEIVYIKGIHNTVADAILRLEYDPSVNKTAESYLVTKIRETQEAFKDKTGWHSQTLVQCKNRRHHQTWRSKSRVCKSRRRGQNLPSHNNRDSRSTKERSNIKIYYKRNAKTPEKRMRFQLIENTKVPCKEDK